MKKGLFGSWMNNEKSKDTFGDMLKHMYDTTDDIIFICNSNHYFTYSNPAAKKLLNISSNDIDKPLLSDVNNQLYNLVTNESTDLPFSKDIILTINDHDYHFSLKCHPIHPSTNRPDGYCVSLRNIDNIMHKLSNLESLKKIAVADTNAKGMFLANMSHELRTPLNAIIGMSELLIETHLEPNQEELINNINQSANVLYDIINTILDFSKLEANQMGLEKATLNINKVLNEIQTIFSHEARVKNIDLIFDIDASIPIVLGDQVRLRQIIVNFLSNAIKFTHIGSVTVSAKLIKKSRNSVKIEFSVEDTGIGIPVEVRDKIFEPFIQEDVSITRKFGGTGLGLPICKSLIDLHGGTLDISSTIGQGSKFTFILPFTLAPNETSYSADNHSAIPDTNISSNVLVAEDNKTNQKLLEMQLKKYKYNVKIVENGQQVVEEYFENDYDIIIMDCQMPIMDGFCATLIIRQQEELFNKHIPIVALTASALKEDKEKCLECGMDDYITKPVKIQTLHNTLQHWLTKNHE